MIMDLIMGLCDLFNHYFSLVVADITEKKFVLAHNQRGRIKGSWKLHGEGCKQWRGGEMLCLSYCQREHGGWLYFIACMWCKLYSYY